MNKEIDKKFDFYEYLTNEILCRFEKTIEMDEIEREKLYLGIMTLLINGIKSIIILGLASLVGVLDEVIFMILVFFALRLWAAGLYAKSSFKCTVICISAYIIGAYMSINYPVNIYHCFGICNILIILIYRYSPADTENRPILGRKKREILKRRAVITALLILIINIILFNEKIINLTMYAMLMQTICILPHVYKIFNRRYNNYEMYE